MNANSVTNIRGTAIPLRGDDIDTDRIIPARYLRCVSFDGLGEHVLEDDRAQNSDHVFNQERFQDASILIAGKNFGCGSSREHAPQALHKWGINGIIAPSFAEIFFANCQAIGVPCVVVSEADCEALYTAAEADSRLVVVIHIEDATIAFADQTISGAIPPGVRRSFVQGTWNATSVLLEAVEKIERLKMSLPYLNDYHLGEA